jgi:hypothetical protein
VQALLSRKWLIGSVLLCWKARERAHAGVTSPQYPAGTAPLWCAWYYKHEKSVKGVARPTERHYSGSTGDCSAACAKKKHLTMSRALELNATYRRFMSEADPERKGEAGKDLIRAIFGKDAIAEDSIT